jgi:hypothetical protein
MIKFIKTLKLTIKFIKTLKLMIKFIKTLKLMIKFIKALKLMIKFIITFKVLWTMKLWYVLAILVILDHSTVFRVIIPDVVLIQLSYWGWAQSCSKHVEDSNKHIIKETVRHVGHLPELYKEANSEKCTTTTVQFFRK